MPATPSTSDSPAANSTPLLAARNLICERDDRVLFAGLDLELRSGEVVQLKGSNGSGKTTLLRILCGLNDSFSGEIQWQGRPIKGHSDAYLSNLLYIGHHVGVNKVLTPVENLRWSCALHEIATDVDILQALDRIGLRGYEESRCMTLSAGQKQRVSLARLLISPARLWILDEPFTTLDVNGVKLLETLLADHVENSGAALVTTHHNLSVAHHLRVLNLDTHVPDETILQPEGGW